MCCDLLQTATQELHVIHTDGCQYRHLRGRDQICSILPAAHTGLQHDDIALFLPEIPKSQRRLDLKRRGMMEPVLHHCLAMLPDDFQTIAQILMGDLLLSDLDFFTIINNNR